METLEDISRANKILNAHIGRHVESSAYPITNDDVIQVPIKELKKVIAIISGADLKTRQYIVKIHNSHPVRVPHEQN